MVRKFNMSLVAKTNKRNSTGEARVPKIPKVSELPDADKLAQVVTLPRNIAQRFQGLDAILAFDIETHDKVKEKVSIWTLGKYGCQARVSPHTLHSLRIVQIGWAVGNVGAPIPQTSSRIVKPHDFFITQEGTRIHGISQERAEESGEALEDVLTDFMATVQLWRARGVRLAAHHLEFDAGIIAAEMERSCLFQLRRIWEDLLCDCICTMDPDIASWLRSENGIMDYRDDKPMSRNIPLGLVDATRLLVPNCEEHCSQHHAADKDSMMTWLVCRELVKRSAIPLPSS